MFYPVKSGLTVDLLLTAILVSIHSLNDSQNRYVSPCAVHVTPVHVVVVRGSDAAHNGCSLFYPLHETCSHRSADNAEPAVSIWEGEKKWRGILGLPLDPLEL